MVQPIRDAIVNRIEISGGGGVSSLNSLTGAINLLAGTNITITPIGNDLQIVASGGGGTPGGSSGQLQYNNGGSFGGTTAVVYATSGVHLTYTAQSSTTKIAELLAASGQSVDLQSNKNAAGVITSGISSIANYYGKRGNSGNSNAVFGSTAGTVLTTGDDNAIFGEGAGTSLNTGASNAFFGRFAGSNITGNSNTCLGYQTGQSTGAGIRNVFIGAAAGAGSGTKDNNVCIGFAAGASLTTGSANILIGPSTGSNITTASNLIFVGITAGQNNTSGVQNVALGEAGGYYNATGNNNAYFGYYSYGSGLGSTTNNLSAVTCLGAYSDAYASNTINFSSLANEIIGYGQTGGGTKIRERWGVKLAWNDSADATRKAQVREGAYDTAWREAIRYEADGSAAKLSFFAANAVSQQSGEIGGGLVNLGLFSSVNPTPSVLSITTGIDAKTVATTNLYTVPAGKTAIITAATIRCTAATSITIGPTLGIGVAANEDDIFASTAITALTTTAKIFGFASVGMSVSVATAGVIKVGIDAGSTGTSQTLAIDLIGYLI